MAKRRFLGLLGFVTGVFAGSVLFRRSTGAAPRPRRRLLRRRLDGVVRRRLAGGGEAAARRAGRRSPPHAGERSRSPRRSSSTPISRATSCCAPASARATTSTSTASRRGPTCCGRSASGSPRPSRSTRRTPTRLAGAGARRGRTGRGGVSRVRPAVPDRAQGGEGVRHRESARGPLRGGRVRLPRRGRRHVRRARCSTRSRRCARAGLVVHTAVCVVDREEGGADALARHAVRLRPLFRAGELLGSAKSPAKPHG